MKNILFGKQGELYDRAGKTVITVYYLMISVVSGHGIGQSINSYTLGILGSLILNLLYTRLIMSSVDFLNTNKTKNEDKGDKH